MMNINMDLIFIFQVSYQAGADTDQVIYLEWPNFYLTYPLKRSNAFHQRVRYSNSLFSPRIK